MSSLMLGQFSPCATGLGQGVLAWRHLSHCSLGTPPYGVPTIPAPGARPSPVGLS